MTESIAPLHRMNSGWKAALATGALALLSVTAACSGGAAPTSSAGKIDRDASGVVLTDRVIPSSLDPVAPANGNTYVIAPFFMIYDTLLDVAEDGSLAPGLAEEWKLTSTSIELTLREGVAFQDGSPLDAEAVKANIERLDEVAALGPQAMRVRDRVESVEVIDDRTLILQMPDGIGTVPHYLANQTGMMVSPTAIGADGVVTDAVGSGPYSVESFEAGAAMSVTRWDDYWNFDAETAAEWRFEYVSDPLARENLLKDGQATIAMVAPRSVIPLEKAGFEVLRVDKPTFTVVHFDHSVPGLDDVRVRRAIQHAIDRDGWAQSVSYGQSDPIWQFFTEGHPLYLEEYDGYYPYDPEKARELLSEAGYADGLGLSMQVLGTNEYRKFAETIQAMLAEVGITVTLNVIDPSQFTEFSEGGKHDMMLGATTPLGDPWEDVALWVGDGADYQPGGAASPELAEILTEAGQLLPGDEGRTALLKEAIGEAVEQAAFLPIVTLPIFYASSEGCLTGLEPYIAAGADKWAHVSLTDRCS